MTAGFTAKPASDWAEVVGARGKKRSIADGPSSSVLKPSPAGILVSPKPECVRPRRARSRVLLFRSAQGFRDERIRQLSAASRIDPASLRMNATTVSWTRSGRRVRYRYR
jgi:hypothetical protein